MKKKYNFKALIFISVFMLVSTLLFHPKNVLAFQVTDNQVVSTNKVWTIQFTDEVGFDSVTQQGITVVDSKDNTINVNFSLGSGNKSVKVAPPQGGYTPGEHYTLTVGKSVHSKNSVSMKQNRAIHFSIQKDGTTTSISIIDDITASVNQNTSYTLPSTVKAYMSDGTTQDVAVTWDKQVDTTQAGTFVYYGSVSGYNSTVKLTLTVNSIVTKPQVPTGVQAWPLSSSQIAVQWNAVSGVDGYYVYYSDDGSTWYPWTDSNGNKKLLQWQSGYSATLNSIPSGRTIYFKVTSVKNNIESDFSTIVSATTPSAKPQAPTGLSAWTLTDNSTIAIQWNAVSGVDGYYLYYSTNNSTWYAWRDSSGNKKLLPWQSGYSATLNNVPAGTTVYFKVSSVKNNVESDYSSIVNVTTASSIKYFPLMSDVPQPSISYDNYNTNDAGTLVSYYYSLSKVSSSFISDYVTLLTNNGFSYYSTSYLSNGTPVVYYTKNGKLIGITVIGDYLVIAGSIR